MQDHQTILQLLSDYFRGLHAGDVALLRSLFDPEAVLFAELKGASYRKSLDAYLDGVAQRSSPAQLNEPFRMRVLSLDVTHDMAIAKVYVPALGFNFYNYLSLLRKGGSWRIVSKVFDDVPAGPEES
jgi:hypothetical protein